MLTHSDGEGKKENKAQPHHALFSHLILSIKPFKIKTLKKENPVS